jgi:hypothetical protein
LIFFPYTERKRQPTEMRKHLIFVYTPNKAMIA